MFLNNVVIKIYLFVLLFCLKFLFLFTLQASYLLLLVENLNKTTAKKWKNTYFIYLFRLIYLIEFISFWQLLIGKWCRAFTDSSFVHSTSSAVIFSKHFFFINILLFLDLSNRRYEARLDFFWFWIDWVLNRFINQLKEPISND